MISTTNPIEEMDRLIEQSERRLSELLGAKAALLGRTSEAIRVHGQLLHMKAEMVASLMGTNSYATMAFKPVASSDDKLVLDAIKECWPHRLDKDSLKLGGLETGMCEVCVDRLLEAGLLVSDPHHGEMYFTGKFVKEYLVEVGDIVEVGDQTYVSPKEWPDG